MYIIKNNKNKIYQYIHYIFKSFNQSQILIKKKKKLIISSMWKNNTFFKNILTTHKYHNIIT